MKTLFTEHTSGKTPGILTYKMFGEDIPGRSELLIVDKPGIYGLWSIDGWRMGSGRMNYVISRI